MSPFIITTKRPCFRDDDCAMYACSCRNTGWRPTSRRAVATLEDAKQEVWDALAELRPTHPLRDQVHDLERSGRFELPDGSVIKVKPVPRRGLVRELREVAMPPGPGRWSMAEIITAFNAKQAR